MVLLAFSEKELENKKQENSEMQKKLSDVDVELNQVNIMLK